MSVSAFRTLLQEKQSETLWGEKNINDGIFFFEFSDNFFVEFHGISSIRVASATLEKHISGVP
jgi:hypothetical protein